jgi:MerR family transcriptional regulator, copper efflux regulator
MIRYYEQIGLIPPPDRTDSGYRVYSERDVHTLRFIRRARDLGFSVDQLGELLALWSDRNRASAEVKRIALEHITELELKIKELQEMRQALVHLSKHCHGDDRPDCPILEDLAGSQSTKNRQTDRTRFGAGGANPRRRTRLQ